MLLPHFIVRIEGYRQSYRHSTCYFTQTYLCHGMKADRFYNKIMLSKSSGSKEGYDVFIT
jgi:hypothetical protein